MASIALHPQARFRPAARGWSHFVGGAPKTRRSQTALVSAAPLRFPAPRTTIGPEETRMANTYLLQSVAAAAGGAVRSIKTTPLLSTAEGVEAMKKASASGYKAPSRSAHA